MSDTRTRFFTLLIVTLILAAAAAPSSVVARQKGKEEQKPAATTVDAWRQALPAEAEAAGEAAGNAAAVQTKAAAEETRAGLIALERKWMEALRLRDASVLGQLVSDDFTLVSPRLVVSAGERDRYFTHATRELNLASYDFEELTVRLYGRAAVVSGRLKQSAKVGAEDWGGSYLITDVWVSRDGFWRVVSRHATLLQDKR